MAGDGYCFVMPLGRMPAVQIDACHHHALLLETKHDVLSLRLHADQPIIALAPDAYCDTATVHQANANSDRAKRRNVEGYVHLEYPARRSAGLGRRVIVSFNAQLSD